MISESTSLTQEVSLERSGLAIRDEEPINATTHGLGCLISACGMFWMIAAYAGESPASLVVSLLFTSLLTLTYGVSALSHAVSATREKRLLRAWDQGVIYLLIVATYTPFLWKYVPSPILEITLGVVWIAAMAGFVSKVVLLRRIDEDFSPYSYIALGWIPALTVCYYVPWDCLRWIVLGGVIYSVGVCFLRLDKAGPYFVSGGHPSVIALSACHFFAVYTFVLG